mgnify:CR=1 FL=1
MAYTKRPLWQWIILYIIVGAIVYAAIYYFVVARKGGYQPYTQSPTQLPEEISQTQPEVKLAELMAVGTYQGSGIATKSFDGKKFVHMLEASVSDPAEGKFYEGWLVDKQPTLRFFSTGRMIKQGDVYSLTFTADMDYPDYNDVVITEETESLGLDGKPEAHVLEGSFSE